MKPNNIQKNRLEFNVVARKVSVPTITSQVMKPIIVVDEAVELVGWRYEVLTNNGSWAVRPEVVQDCPRADV